MTTPQEDRYLRISALRNRFATARQIEMDFRRGTGVHLSNQTTRNRLHEDGIESPEACLSADFDTITSQSPPGVRTRSCYMDASAMAYSSVYR